MKEMKSLPEQIFDNIEKTHQAPRCRICNLAFPRLDQKVGLCDLCKHARKQHRTLEVWL